MTPAQPDPATGSRTPQRPPRADWRLLISSPWQFLALGCGSGLSPVAPGTAGSLFGWASYLLLQRVLPASAWPLLLLIGFVGGIWICDRAARELGLHDPAPVVWDEVVAMWLVLWAAQAGLDWVGRAHLDLPWGIQVACFALFRLFDAVKRGPVGWVDRKVSGGLGIMLDDLVAALLSLLALAVGLGLWAWMYLSVHGLEVVR